MAQTDEGASDSSLAQILINVAGALDGMTRLQDFNLTTIKKCFFKRGFKCEYKHVHIRTLPKHQKSSRLASYYRPISHTSAIFLQFEKMTTTTSRRSLGPSTQINWLPVQF